MARKVTHLGTYFPAEKFGFQGFVFHPVSHTASLPSSGQPMARLAVFKFSAGVSLVSQRAAVMRWPLKLAASSDMSQRIGAPMISGRSILLRSQPDASLISAVSVGPPGTSTFT